jgi:hypothetical protein
MLVRFYIAIGITLCVGLGAAFAMGWKAPDLGLASSGSGSGYRAGIRSYGYGASGWSFGK